MKLIVNPSLFAVMQQAAIDAEIYGTDPALAAWEKTGLAFPNGILPVIEIVVVDRAETKLVHDDTRAQFESECG